jgi:excisionase family DNA binding protein
MATIQEREFYTVSEAARVLDVSRTTIWRWIDIGKLPAYRVGGRTIRIRREDVETMRRPARVDRDELEPDIWANYDPERARASLRSLRGLLKGVDREKLLKDIHEARGQDSKGRPAD